MESASKMSVTKFSIRNVFWDFAVLIHKAILRYSDVKIVIINWYSSSKAAHACIYLWEPYNGGLSRPGSTATSGLNVNWCLSNPTYFRLRLLGTHHPLQPLFHYPWWWPNPFGLSAGFSLDVAGLLVVLPRSIPKWQKHIDTLTIVMESEIKIIKNELEWSEPSHHRLLQPILPDLLVHRLYLSPWKLRQLLKVPTFHSTFL